MGGDDLYDKAVDTGHFKPGAVDRTAIGTGAVGGNEVEDKSLSLDKLNQNAQNTINNKADGNHKHDSDYAAKNHDHNYAAQNHSHNYAAQNHSHNGYADSGHKHAISDITGLQKKLDDLERLAKRGGSEG